MAEHNIQRGLDNITQSLAKGDAPIGEKLAQGFTTYFPDIAQGWFLLGVSKHLQRKHDEALSAFNKAIALEPSHIQAMRAKAAVLSEQHRLNEALAVCEQALQLAPDDNDLLTNLATVLQQLGRYEEAIEQFDRALAQQPNHLFALINRGAVLIRLNRLEEAIAHNRQFVQLHPTIPDAYYNLSEALFGLYRYEEALEVCDAGLQVTPHYAGLHMNRGKALAALRRFEESQDELAQAQILDPDLLQRLMPDLSHLPSLVDPYANAEMVYLELNAEALQKSFWQDRSTFIETIQGFMEHGTPTGFALHDKKLAFALLGLTTSPQLHQQILKQVSEYVEDTAWLYGLPPFRHTLRAINRIRIGYVSPDFRDHPIGHLTKALYALHDRNKFEIHGYSLVRAEQDPVQQQIHDGCDFWHELSDVDNVAAAKQIHHDGIDILIDLAGYTKQACTEIFALRPAPIQVNYLGYPGTMGATFMDYLIGDPIITPLEHATHFTEKLLLMPHTYQPNSRPQELTEPPSRAECGLPENGFVFCGFNQAFKISPDIFDIWMRLLHQVPGSVLWLLEAGPIAEQNLRHEANLRGVHEEKLIFAPRVPWMQHLIRQQHADLLLDTFPYNAHTTASDALWAGVPLVTCMGETFPSRVAASLLHAVGLPELVTTSFDAYEQLAARLASSPGELQEIRQKLAHNRPSAPLFDTQQFVRDLESLYERMFQQQQ